MIWCVAIVVVDYFGLVSRLGSTALIHTCFKPRIMHVSIKLTPNFVGQ